MSRRNTIGIIIAIAFAIGVLIWWLLRKETPEPAVVPETQPITVENRTDGGAQLIGQPEATPESTALRTARFVAERYGTFSSDEGLAGTQELLAVASPEFSAWLRVGYINEIRSRIPSDNFYAESARVLSARVETINENSATVAIQLQQQITEGTSISTKNSEQRINLVRSGESWFVDAIF